MLAAGHSLAAVPSGRARWRAAPYRPQTASCLGAAHLTINPLKTDKDCHVRCRGIDDSHRRLGRYLSYLFVFYGTRFAAPGLCGCDVLAQGHLVIDCYICFSRRVDIYIHTPSLCRSVCSVMCRGGGRRVSIYVTGSRGISSCWVCVHATDRRGWVSVQVMDPGGGAVSFCTSPRCVLYLVL